MKESMKQAVIDKEEAQSLAESLEDTLEETLEENAEEAFVLCFHFLPNSYCVSSVND